MISRATKWDTSCYLFFSFIYFFKKVWVPESTTITLDRMCDSLKKLICSHAAVTIIVNIQGPCAPLGSLNHHPAGKWPGLMYDFLWFYLSCFHKQKYDKSNSLILKMRARGRACAYVCVCVPVYSSIMHPVKEEEWYWMWCTSKTGRHDNSWKDLTGGDR